MAIIKRLKNNHMKIIAKNIIFNAGFKNHHNIYAIKIKLTILIWQIMIIHIQL